MSFDDAVADFPAWAINEQAPNVSYTPWHIVEHLRITQWDILRYIEDPTQHVSPDWPVGYWPAPDAETDADGLTRRSTSSPSCREPPATPSRAS